MLKWTPLSWTPLLTSVVEHPGLSAVWSGNSDELEQLANTTRAHICSAHAEADTTACAASDGKHMMIERDASFFGSVAAQCVRAARSALDSTVESLFQSVNVGAVFEVRQ